MNRKFRNVILYFIGALILSWVTFILLDIFLFTGSIDLEQRMETFVTLIVSGSSLSIALSLYDRTGFKKTYYEEQFKLVLKAFEVFRLLTYEVKYRTENNQIFFWHSQFLVSQEISLDRVLERYQNEVVFLNISECFSLRAELEVLVSSPFFPKSLNDIKNFFPETFVEEGNTNYLAVNFNGSTESVYGATREKVILQELIDNHQIILNRLRKWLSINSDLDLNV